MRAFKGVISKTEFLKELRKHQKADLFMKGAYWNGEKGCAVGCSLRSVSNVKNLNLTDFDDHSRYEDLLGVPEWLARLEDRIFEGVSVARSKVWPVEFAQAINPGADLDKIKTPFLKIVVASALNSAADACEDRKIPKHPALLRAAAKAIAKAKNPDWDEARKIAAYAAADAAYAAAYTAATARYTANAAANAAATYYADAAADAAYYAAYYADAAACAANAADYAAARQLKYEEFADSLLKLLRGCK